MAIARYVVTAFVRNAGRVITDSRGYKWNDDGSGSESFEVIAESMSEAIEQVQSLLGAGVFRITIEGQREVLTPPRLLTMIGALEDKTTKEGKP